MTPSFNHQQAWEDFTRHIWLKAATFIYFLGVLGASTYAIAATWDEWWPYPELDIRDLDDAKPAIYAFLAGAVGSTLYAFRGFYQAVGPEKGDDPRYHYDPNWTIWYLSRPIIGAFLGAFTYAILRTGVGTLGAANEDATSTTAYFVFAFLGGFGATDAFGWMARTSHKLFSSDGSDEGAQGGGGTTEPSGNERGAVSVDPTDTGSP